MTIIKVGKKILLGKKKILGGLVVLLIIAALGAAGAYYYNKYNDSQDQIAKLSDPSEVAKTQLADIISKVSQLTDLPKDESPTLATVADPEKLKGQPFFANSQKGDRVLIYTQAKKAFLYRPSTDKLLEIAPINIGDAENQSATQP